MVVPRLSVLRKEGFRSRNLTTSRWAWAKNFGKNFGRNFGLFIGLIKAYQLLSIWGGGQGIAFELADLGAFTGTEPIVIGCDRSLVFLELAGRGFFSLPTWSFSSPLLIYAL